MMSAVDKLAILVTGDPTPAVERERGDFANIIAATIGETWSGDYQAIDARHAGLPELSASITGLIITGSSANVPNRDPWILNTEAWLRAVVSTQLPILGICFGHQILAQALGGEVVRNPRGREMSTIDVDCSNTDPLFDGLAPRFSANACHVDSVLKVPDGATVLAHSPLDNHQAIRFSAHCYGVQFHPEFDRSIMRHYIAARREPISAEGQDPDVLLKRARDTPASAQVLRNFVQQHAGR